MLKSISDWKNDAWDSQKTSEKQSKTNRTGLNIIRQLDQRSAVMADRTLVLLFKFFIYTTKYTFSDSLYVDRVKKYVEMSTLSENHLEDFSNVLSLVLVVKLKLTCSPKSCKTILEWSTIMRCCISWNTENRTASVGFIMLI